MKSTRQFFQQRFNFTVAFFDFGLGRSGRLASFGLRQRDVLVGNRHQGGLHLLGVLL